MRRLANNESEQESSIPVRQVDPKRTFSMSRDADPQHRLWLSLGYGGKTARQPTWRYWKTQPKQWEISAPNELANFQQRDRTVFFKGKEILTGDTQWSATWQTVAYFYEKVLPTLTPPPLSKKIDA